MKTPRQYKREIAELRARIDVSDLIINEKNKRISELIDANTKRLLLTCRQDIVIHDQSISILKHNLKHKI